MSRLGIDLDIYVFGIPPADYNATIEGLNATATIDYTGALHLYIHYEALQGILVPANTAVKTVIQLLNLTIILGVT